MFSLMSLNVSEEIYIQHAVFSPLSGRTLIAVEYIHTSCTKECGVESSVCRGLLNWGFLKLCLFLVDMYLVGRCLDMLSNRSFLYGKMLPALCCFLSVPHSPMWLKEFFFIISSPALLPFSAVLSLLPASPAADLKSGPKTSS